MTQALQSILNRVDEYVPTFIMPITPAPKDAQGVEVELEFVKETNLELTKEWKMVQDPSLRGYGIEFVLKKPTAPKNLKKAFLSFETLVKDCRIHDSIRTSTHIHHNVQDKTGLDILSIFGVYWIIEDLLMDYCGRHRKGNYNCLTLSETGALHKQYCEILRQFTPDPTDKNNYQPHNKTLYFASTDYFRYSALNPKPLTSFGSLEFRGQKKLTTEKELSEWSGIIQQIIYYQEKTGLLDIVLKRFTTLTPNEIVKDILGPYAEIVLAYGCSTWEEDLLENLPKIITLKNSLFTWNTNDLKEFFNKVSKEYELYKIKEPLTASLNYERHVKPKPARPVLEWPQGFKPPIVIHDEDGDEIVRNELQIDFNPLGLEFDEFNMAPDQVQDIKNFLFENEINRGQFKPYELYTNDQKRLYPPIQRENPFITQRRLPLHLKNPTHQYTFLMGKLKIPHPGGEFSIVTAPIKLKIYNSHGQPFINWVLI